jgi:hypothetical protein
MLALRNVGRCTEVVLFNRDDLCVFIEVHKSLQLRATQVCLTSRFLLVAPTPLESKTSIQSPDLDATELQRIPQLVESRFAYSKVFCGFPGIANIELRWADYASVRDHAPRT